MENFVRAHERLEDLGLKGYYIIQDPKKFCFGIDSVLLAWFSRKSIKRQSSIIDLGTGTGIIPLLIKGHCDVQKLEAIEIQASMADMARRSVAINKLTDCITIHQGDLRTYTGFNHQIYDIIICNPPYMKVTHGAKSPTDAMAIARHELYLTIEDLGEFAKTHLKDRGKLYLIHRADRLTDIITSLKKNKIEPKRIAFVHPFVHRAANLVLIEGVKSGKPFIKVESPVVVYDQNGEYSQIINEIYGTPRPQIRK